MLTVTDAASAHLAQMLKQQDAPKDIAVLFVYEGQGIAGIRTVSARATHRFSTKAGRSCCWTPRGRKYLPEGTLDPVGAKLTLVRPKEGEEVRR